MKIKVVVISRSQPTFVVEGVAFFLQKIRHMVPVDWIEIHPKKKFESPELTQKYESELFLTHIEPSDEVILLDEKGTTFRSSIDFSNYINKKQISGTKQFTFLIGGAFGFDDTIYHRAQSQISLAPLTFSHQMIRLIFLEQLYRGYAILHRLPYHHE